MGWKRRMEVTHFLRLKFCQIDYPFKRAFDDITKTIYDKNLKLCKLSD